jgi:hypothetical protein
MRPFLSLDNTVLVCLSGPAEAGRAFAGAPDLAAMHLCGSGQDTLLCSALKECEAGCQASCAQSGTAEKGPWEMLGVHLGMAVEVNGGYVWLTVEPLHADSGLLVLRLKAGRAASECTAIAATGASPSSQTESWGCVVSPHPGAAASWPVPMITAESLLVLPLFSLLGSISILRVAPVLGVAYCEGVCDAQTAPSKQASSATAL